MKYFTKAVLGSMSALCLCNVAFANSTPSLGESTPENMTCHEYVDLNPRAMTPVAFWVVNKDTDYKGGDFVDWNEVETISVPLLLKICDEQPKSKITQWIDKLK